MKVKVHFNKTSALASDEEFEHLNAPVSNAPATSSGARTLADVKVGAVAVITGVEGERPLAIRLMEMGLLPGTRVEVVRIAPLGDPMELRLRGFHLSIRRDEARGLAVEPE